LEAEITTLLKDKGPLTGAEMLSFLGTDTLILWRACRLSRELTVQTIGTKYLRLDSRINDLARLSPSILREFLTYSVIGLSTETYTLKQKVKDVALHIREISKAKLRLAKDIFQAVIGGLESDVVVGEHLCTLIAGDIVYGMAHDVPRPERSTGRLVKGSDMDLIVIVDDTFPRELMERLDSAIYEEKRSVLMSPHLREEIDYVVKDMARVREQLEFDTFKRIMACKILQEGVLLWGELKLFERLKAMLKDHGITQKLASMEERARIHRKEAEEYLLRAPPEKIRNEGLFLFYPAEESEEFE